MNTIAKNFVVALVTVASAAAIGTGLADRAAAQPAAEVVQLERVVVVGHRAEAPVEFAVLPRVVVTGHRAAQADVQVAPAL